MWAGIFIFQGDVIWPQYVSRKRYKLRSISIKQSASIRVYYWTITISILADMQSSSRFDSVM